jgi:hypothetical protein
VRLTRDAFRLMPSEVRRWSALQKLRNPFAGLRFVRRDSGGGLILVSRHWPHLLCWSWSLSWAGGWSFRRGRPRGICRYHIGPLHLSWQNYDDMVGLGKAERSAAAYLSRRALAAQFDGEA